MRALSLFIISTLAVSQAQAISFTTSTPLKSYECANCEELARESLSTSWAMENTKPLVHETKHQQLSRKYQVKASLKQLKEGFAIYTQGPEAIVRISPVNPKSITKLDFLIKNKAGTKLSLMDASSLFSKDEALKNTAFAGNTLSLAQLKPELGAGKFIISATPLVQAGQSIAKDDELYVIHVFDRNSAAFLSIGTDKAHYNYGDEMHLTITLEEDDLTYPIDAIEAAIINPAGESTPIEIKQIGKNIYTGSMLLNSEENTEGANWYLMTDVTSYQEDMNINRHAHTAFSYSIPSAAVRAINQLKPKTFNFSATIEAATDSRYSLQTVLYATDSKGKIQAVQTAQSSAWFTKGINMIDFSFDFDPKKSDFKAPFYLGYIRLTDYGQMKPVFIHDEPIDISAN